MTKRFSANVNKTINNRQEQAYRRATNVFNRKLTELYYFLFLSWYFCYCISFNLCGNSFSYYFHSIRLVMKNTNHNIRTRFSQMINKFVNIFTVCSRQPTTYLIQNPSYCNLYLISTPIIRQRRRDSDLSSRQINHNNLQLPFYPTNFTFLDQVCWRLTKKLSVFISIRGRAFFLLLSLSFLFSFTRNILSSNFFYLLVERSKCQISFSILIDEHVQNLTLFSLFFFRHHYISHMMHYTLDNVR